MAMFLETLKNALSSAGVRSDQCSHDDERGILIIHPDEAESAGTTRVVPAAALAIRHAACANDPQAQRALVEAAAQAFGHGAADVPNKFDACGERLLPQLWPVEKIVAFQAMIAQQGLELPHCGLHGEQPPLLGVDFGVVLVHEYVAECSEGTASFPVETPVLSNDIERWDLSFTQTLQVALDNLRARTKAGPAPNKRWEHHASGCGQSSWQDRFDASRAALLPNLVAKRKRPDGLPEPGGHVVVLATTSCVLASTSKNPLGLCFMGDTLHVQMPKGEAVQQLSTTPMRLLKMKDSSAGSHPLNQTSGEGLVWRWMPYSPGGPPTRASGEFSVPVDAGEVEAILNAVEAGGTVPVFTQQRDPVPKKEPASQLFASRKEEANALFKAGDFVKALAAYDKALSCGAPTDADAAIIHANAAQALLNLAAVDEPRREACAAEALRRGMAAVELDGTYAKAHLRCAAACEILGEKAAAEEFKAKADACLAAAKATQAVKRREVEERREAREAQRAQVEQRVNEQLAREALLEAERAREAEKERLEAEQQAASKGEATDSGAAGTQLGLSALFGLPGSGVDAGALGAAGLAAGLPQAPAAAGADLPPGASPLLCSR